MSVGGRREPGTAELDVLVRKCCQEQDFESGHGKWARTREGGYSVDGGEGAEVLTLTGAETSSWAAGRIRPFKTGLCGREDGNLYLGAIGTLVICHTA